MTYILDFYDYEALSKHSRKPLHRPMHKTKPKNTKTQGIVGKIFSHSSSYNGQLFSEGYVYWTARLVVMLWV
ncbi:hypothetical protein Plhal304r1_c018g0065871 [Plasmopara halstedii]